MNFYQCDNRLFGGFSFGWFLIAILKCFGFYDRRTKEFKVLKCFVKIFVLFLIEGAWFKYLSKSQSFSSY